MRCALCGHEGYALGATVWRDSHYVSLCHGCTDGFDCRPKPSCYERWTVYGERP